MTRNPRLRGAPGLAALLLCACGGAATPAPTPLVVSQQWAITRLGINSEEAHDFAACEPGFALVPSNGGVLLAGWNAWIIKPGEPRIASVACDAHSRLYAIEDGKVVIESASAPGTTGALTKGESRAIDPPAEADLPAGTWQVLSGAQGPVWLWGKLADSNDSSILRWEPPSRELEVVYSGAHPIRAASVIGTKGFAAVLDEDLVLWEDGHTPFRFGHVGAGIDGLAVDTEGDIFLSSGKGVVEMHADTNWSIVSAGVHGPLRMRDDVLYVLVHDPSIEILRLTPTSDG